MGEFARTWSATYNSVAMTSAGSFGGTSWNTFGQVFYLKEATMPAAGAHDIVVTASGAFAGDIDCGAVSFSGVDQTTPVSGYNHSTATAVTASLDITSATGNIVVSTVSEGSATATYMFTTTGGTVRWNRDGNTGAPTATWGATQTGAATTTCGWEFGTMQRRIFLPVVRSAYMTPSVFLSTRKPVPEV